MSEKKVPAYYRYQSTIPKVRVKILLYLPGQGSPKKAYHNCIKIEMRTKKGTSVELCSKIAIMTIQK